MPKPGKEVGYEFMKITITKSALGPHNGEIEFENGFKVKISVSNDDLQQIHFDKTETFKEIGRQDPNNPGLTITEYVYP